MDTLWVWAERARRRLSDSALAFVVPADAELVALQALGDEQSPAQAAPGHNARLRLEAALEMAGVARTARQHEPATETDSE